MRVPPSWIDENSHMNVAYYHMAFDRATDRFWEELGLGEDLLKKGSGSMFALEDHMTYQRELREGDPIRVTLQLLDFDRKRVLYFLRMFHGERGFLAATCEHLSIFVDLRLRRSAEMPPSMREALARLHDEHRKLRRPAEAGRPMRIRRGD